MIQSKTIKFVTILIISYWLLFSCCAMAGQKTLLMATPTSTDNTGLLDYMAPHFTEETGIKLKWIATGTGKALKLGQNCDADILLVHAPGAERKYVSNGYGINRREVMYNDFVIIGPASDSAKINGKSVIEALQLIKRSKNLFVSRGDNSGTNKKEITLWIEAGMSVPDKETWYIQTGQGMLSTINIAVERSGYTMTDRGTYIKYEDNFGGNPFLKILVEGDAVLINQYSVLIVNHARCKNVQNGLAIKFSDWIVDRKAQKLIKDFKLLGKQLFVPNARQ